MQFLRGRDLLVFVRQIEFMNGVIRPAMYLKGGMASTNLRRFAVSADDVAIFVSDDRNFHVHISHGSHLVAHSRPPWASMIERQIDRPMPMPSGLVV